MSRPIVIFRGKCWLVGPDDLFLVARLGLLLQDFEAPLFALLFDVLEDAGCFFYLEFLRGL